MPHLRPDDADSKTPTDMGRADFDTHICLTDEQVAEVAYDGIDDERYAAHFAECSACRDRVASLKQADGFLAEKLSRGLASIPKIHSDRKMIGRFPVFGRLGEPSGQSEVFRVKHPDFEFEVVLKLSLRRLSTSKSADQDRLLREGRLLSKLHHPGLVRVFEMGIDDERPFLVMEYIPGKTLERYVRDDAVNPAQAASLVVKVARAIHYAHTQGVLHRDIKPANIIVDEGGTNPRVIDFGLALMTNAFSNESDESGSISGTIQYMAPEQASGRSDLVSERTDVFGLGAVLYSLLTGKPPYHNGSMIEILEQAKAAAFNHDALNRRPIPSPLARVCMRAMSLDPKDRYPSAAAFATALEASVRPRRKVRYDVCFASIFAMGIVAAMIVGQPFSNPTRTIDARIGPLKLQVYRGEGQIDFADALPLLSADVKDRKKGDWLRLVVEGSGKMELSAFWLGSDGKLAPFALKKRGGAEGWYAEYPAGYDDTVPLTGNPGTELMVVLGRRKSAVTLNEIAPLLTSCRPTLPEYVAMAVDSRGSVSVVEGEISRGLGKPSNDFRAVAEAKLRSLCDELQKHCDACAVLAIPHGSESPTASFR